MSKINSKSSIFKASIISISLMLTSGTAISSAVTKMENAFPDIPHAVVESLLTASNISVLIAIIFSAWLVNYVSSRKVIIIGLILSLVGGIIPCFIHNFSIIYVSRIILGFGWGLFNSLAVSILHDFYTDGELDKMLGYQSAIQNVGLTITMFIAGLIVNYSWEWSFSVYALTIIPLILFVKNVPETHKNKAEPNQNNGKAQITGYAIGLAVMMALAWIFQITLNLKATTLVNEKNIHNAAFIGTALTIFTISSFIGNLLYAKVVKITKKYTLPIIFSVLAVCYFLISKVGNMTELSILMVIIGLAWSLFLPYSFGQAMAKAPEGSENMNVSIAMVGCNLGCFIAPYVMAGLGNIIGSTSASSAFVICSVSFIVLALILLVYEIKATVKLKSDS